MPKPNNKPRKGNLVGRVFLPHKPHGARVALPVPKPHGIKHRIEALFM